VILNTYRLFSSGLRFCHWIWALCIVVLFFTGLYIGNPMFIGTQGKEPAVAIASLLSMETIRQVHFLTAFILCACLLLRVYLFFTYRGNRLFPDFSSRGYWRGISEMLAYYSLLRTQHRLYMRNPLAATVYVMVYILMFLEAVTGLAMYSMIRPNSLLATVFGPVNHLLGNEYTTHFVHHVIAWSFVVFLLTHIYMVVFNDITEKSGELSSIVSGRKQFPETPVDAKDFLPESAIICKPREAIKK